jgi:dTDP-4-dehydrorhamnose 3,5-epimerase
MRPRVDDSVAKAIRDSATVTSKGEPLGTLIEGVRTARPVVHMDHRGRLFEVYPGPDDFWTDPVVFGHAFTVRPNTLKGWGLHFDKDDRYTLMSGEALILLWDARLDSKTRGQVDRVYLSGEATRQVLIPAGVWHATVNLGSDEVLILDLPTEPYDHTNPDKVRVAIDAPEVPLDVAQFFPRQFNPGLGRDCH